MSAIAMVDMDLRLPGEPMPHPDLRSAVNPLYHVGSYFMPATRRFLAGFLPWIVGRQSGATGT